MNRALRLFHTVRHLRAGQITGRIRQRLYRPTLDTRPSPAVRTVADRWQGCARRPSMTATGFRFLGEHHALGEDWDNPAWPRLWRYNLHYFDDLNASDAATRGHAHRALVARWIDANPPPVGSGWEPYPTALRIVNWATWSWSGNPLDDAARHSLAVQARWLAKRLETHLLGNHLWANAKALVFAGGFFEGAEADAWQRTGLELVRRELAEQILSDGGHFERSPMYHAIVLEDVLDLLQLARLAPARVPAADATRWREIAIAMLRWLRVMSHPDGAIALFNDAAFGIAPNLAALTAYAARLGLPAASPALAALEALPASGYVRLAAGPAIVIADVGAIGPTYLPGHAHADTLSFELSVAGRRVLVNGGTSTYERNAERQRQRGTAAHNTVRVNGADSSEVWASFRVARRARPLDVAWGEANGALWLQGAHDGYRRLPGKPLHQRRWQLDAHGLRINDRIDGRFRCAAMHLHLHPAWRAALDDPHRGALRPRTRGGPTLRWQADAPVRLHADRWCPVFGPDRPSTQLTTALDAPELRFHLTWAPAP